MKHTLSAVIVSLVGMTLVSGCIDNSPPPARVAVPSADRGTPITRNTDAIKPLPPPQDPGMQVAAPPFNDVPIVSQQTPEQPAFVDAYRKVGAPRIVLFVNRTLEGNIIPIDANDPVVRVQRNQRTPQGNSSRSTEVYLRPGQYDEVSARSIDYEAIENIMTDWLSCGGQVTIVSPTMARQRLTDEQVKELQAGRPQAMSEVVQQLGADIFVQVQAHPTRQTTQGLEVRLICEAINVKGGESISRAVVDLPPPLEKTTINNYTRFLARKLMDGMLGTWSAPPPPAPPAPAAAPAPSMAPANVVPSTQP